MEWQPIETAPKDGRMVLIACEGKVFASRFDPVYGPFPWVFVDDWRPAIIGCCDRERDDLVVTNGYPLNVPTHWMPLPAPPLSA